MAATLRQFQAGLVQCGLITAEDLEAFVNSLPAAKRPDSAKALAKRLIRAGKLTRFQAAVLYQGINQPLVLGEYELLDKLGAGGMGQVFKARHRRMDRLVAVKILPAEATKSSENVQRFLREAKAAARLNHPNIVTAYDAREDNGVHYLVMEYVRGEDLGSIAVRRGVLPIEEALDYILQAARGLHYAHQQGVVHRDIKPANLLLDDDGAIKILDMGLARFGGAGEPSAKTLTASDGLTQSGQIMGTVDYMAPEQAEDLRQADFRADIYSLGCSLYRLLAGRPMFGGDTMMKRLLAHHKQEAPSLRESCPQASAGLDAAFRKMVAKSAADRQQSMQEVIDELEQAALVVAPATHAPEKNPADDSQLSVFFEGLEQQAAPTAPRAKDSTFRNRRAGKKDNESPSGPNGGRVAGAAQLRKNPVFLLTGAAIVGGLLLAGWWFFFAGGDPPKPDLAGGGSPGGAGDVSPLDETDPQRRAALAAVAEGGRIVINLGQPPADRVVDDGGALPDGAFRLVQAHFPIDASANDEDLELLAAAGTVEVLTWSAPVSLQTQAQLASMETLTTLHLPISNLNDSHLESISALPNLVELDLSRTRVTDAGLGSLRGLPRLARLALCDTRVSGTGLQELAGAVPLDVLDLSRTLISTAGLEQVRATGVTVLRLDGCLLDEPMLQAIGEMPQLMELSLAGANVDDANVAALASSSLLKKLDLSGALLTDAGLPALAGMKLNELRLRDVLITDAGLGPLAAHSDLASLDLAGTLITDAGADNFKALSKLRQLNLNNTLLSQSVAADLQTSLPQCDVQWSAGSRDLAAVKWALRRGGHAYVRTTGGEELLPVQSEHQIPSADFQTASVIFGVEVSVSDEELAWLDELTALKGFIGHVPNITDAGLKRLADLPALATVDVRGSHVTAAGIAELERAAALKTLALTNIPLTSAHLEAIGRLPALVNLTIQRMELTDAAVQKLTSMEELQNHLVTLNLTDTKIGDAALSGLPKFKHLYVLTLADNPGIGDEALAYVKDALDADNSRLNLSGTAITDEGVKHLEGLRNLIQLDLSDTYVSIQALQRLRRLLPGCEITP